MVGDAHEELAVGLVAGVDVGDGDVSAELASGTTRFATTTRALEEFRVIVVAAIGIIEAWVDLTADRVFEDVGVQGETGCEGLGLARVQVQGDAEVPLLAGALLTVVDIHAVVAAQHVNVDILHSARPVVGNAQEELAVGLVAGVDVGHRYVGGKTARRCCSNRTDRDGDDCQ